MNINIKYHQALKTLSDYLDEKLTGGWLKYDYADGERTVATLTRIFDEEVYALNVYFGDGNTVNRKQLTITMIPQGNDLQIHDIVFDRCGAYHREEVMQTISSLVLKMDESYPQQISETLNDLYIKLDDQLIIKADLARDLTTSCSPLVIDFITQTQYPNDKEVTHLSQLVKQYEEELEAIEEVIAHEL